jgi:tetratricopeptide (TPR) repeat protein
MYGQWSLRVPGSAERAGLIQDGSRRWHVPEALRRLVDFRWLNLTDEAAPYPAADLVVCRNVLMYLDPAVRVRVRERLAAAVLSGGALVIDDLAFSSNAPVMVSETFEANWASSPALVKGHVQRPNTPELYEQARVAADAGQFEQALRLLDDAPPLDLACTWLRALIYIQQDRPSDAIRVIQRCLYLDPTFALGYLTLGNLYAACDDALSARRQWQNAARLTARSAPDDPLPFGEGLTAGDVQSAIGVRAR